MNNLQEALHTFIEESRELLADMESSLLALSLNAPTEEGINAVFRAAHTIKGSAGLFGLDALVGFTHHAESLLDEVRAGEVALDSPLVQLLLQCCDHLHTLITAVEQGQDPGQDALAQRSTELVQQLGTFSRHAPAAPAEAAAPAPATAPALRWRIAVAFGPSVLQNGMDPVSFLRYLHTLGTVEHCELESEAIPPLEAIDPETCHLHFVLHYCGPATQQDLESVFEFVRDDCTLSILPLPAPVPPADVAPFPAPATADAASTPADLPPAPLAIADSEAPSAARQRTQDSHHSVRVDAHKLDHLIDLIGELIIASAGSAEVARRLHQTDMIEANATVMALVEQVRDQALQLRMVKIGGIFNRFQRVVHDVSRELGKDIVLHISGEETELDKTVVERIGDPLTHLVRNAIDHGIEAADVRRARGKPAQGTVHLNAYHESGHIVIEISDDGGGLDRERILAKAVDNGLVEAGRQLSDKEVYALIFEPGFSTAERITNLSGRGVGMDVVRSNITALRGTVELLSQPGQGTTVQVRLPLTLAIINGFQVRVGRSVFVMPLDLVDECIEYTGKDSQRYADLRGQVLPFISLREHFSLQGPTSARPNIVVIQHGNQRFGLLVDELLGETQTVIKPLSQLFRSARGISGSSILGNGSVALILDIPVLHAQMLEAEAAQRALPAPVASPPLSASA